MSSVIECKRCVMSSKADPDITFNEEDICNHCQRYDNLVHTRIAGPETRIQELRTLIERIKRDGKGKEYDCLVGVSGGVDSTYVAYLAKTHGLRPLAVHFDNGWDSELAVKNIQQVLKLPSEPPHCEDLVTDENSPQLLHSLSLLSLLLSQASLPRC